jgi:hypothetical protein
MLGFVGGHREQALRSVRESGVDEAGRAATAVEDGETWIVKYEIVLDTAWTTRSVRMSGRSASSSRSAVLETDGTGSWRVDGARVRPTTSPVLFSITPRTLFAPADLHPQGRSWPLGG